MRSNREGNSRLTVEVKGLFREEAGRQIQKEKKERKV